MTKGPIIFFLGTGAGLCIAIGCWGACHPSGAGVVAIMTGQLGATLCCLVAAWFDTRKD